VYILANNFTNETEIIKYITELICLTWHPVTAIKLYENCACFDFCISLFTLSHYEGNPLYCVLCWHEHIV
jgi:hypothetical protein